MSIGELTGLWTRADLLATRAAVLRRLGLRQTPAEAAFDELATVVARHVSVPIALLRLVKSDSDRFVPGPAAALPEAGVMAFCAHVLSADGVLMVPDARADARCAGNPLVTGDPPVRFLTGAPLRTGGGSVLGMLCVLDTEPRSLGRDQLDDLDAFARQIASQLELRAQVDALTAVAARTANEPGAVRRAHQESAQRWRALVEHSPVAVAVIGSNHRVVYANPKAVDLFDADSLETLAGRLVLDFLVNDDREPTTSIFEAVLHGGPAVLSHRVTLRTFAGGYLTVEISAASVLHGGAPAVQVELRDVTAQAAAEQALQMSERRFRTVFGDSPVAMGLSDENGRWVETNAAFGRLLGVDAAELIGATAQDYAHPADHPRIAASEQGQRDSSDGVLRMEIRFVRPGGELRWALVSVTPTPGPAGESWTLATAQDITARTAAETALRESESDLAAIAAVARCVQSGEDPRPVVVSQVLALAGASTVAMIEAEDADTWWSPRMPASTPSAGGSRCGTRR